MLWLLAVGVAYVALSAAIGLWGADLRLALWRTLTLQLVLTAVTVIAAFRLLSLFLVEPWKRRAMRDELTGLLRSGSFWETADRVLRAVQADGGRVSFVFIDVDDFKALNDRFGHLEGDAALRAVGHVLRAQTRAEDVVGRIGGEEFGWLLPHTARDEAVDAANRLLGDCRGLRVGKIGSIRLSAGIAFAERSGERDIGIWDLARRADGALYRAKAAGKNRVVVAEMD